MQYGDWITVSAMVVLIPLGFVWADRHKASAVRALKLLVAGLVFGALALASYTAARGQGAAGLGAGLALMACGFIALVLLSWSIQTAIAAVWMGSSPKPQGPVQFDRINFRGLMALVVLNAFCWGAVAVWSWTGRAVNLLKPLGILGPGSPRVLTHATEPRQFQLQIFLLVVCAGLALLALVAHYRAMKRRGQV